MKSFFVLLFSGICITLSAQNYSATQNQQNININLPVIEKKVYVEKYRTVYLDKPRVAKKLSAPVCLMGYLWVYPEDLGDFKQQPHNIITNINRMKSHGRSDWRIPTPDELAVLEANANQVGLGDGIYMGTTHSNGNLRLVAAEIPEEFTFGNLVWSLKDVGAPYPGAPGVKYPPCQVDSRKCPGGWRLAREGDYIKVVKEGCVSQLLLSSDGNYAASSEYECKYNSQIFYMDVFLVESSITTTISSLSDRWDDRYYIRCVKEKK